MTDTKTIEFKMNMRYKQGYSGILVGQSRELPFMIVQGKTVDELIDEMLYETQVYFNTFPEEAKKVLDKHGEVLVVDYEEQKEEDQKQQPPKIEEKEEEGWNPNTIPVTVPIPIKTH